MREARLRGLTRKRGTMNNSDLLQPSNPDTVALGQAVEEKFLDVCHTHLQMTGTEIPIPKSMDRDMLRWREMRVRHKRGDYRNSPSELLATKAIAQWTVSMNCTLRKQPIKAVEWRD